MGHWYTAQKMKFSIKDFFIFLCAVMKAITSVLIIIICLTIRKGTKQLNWYTFLKY